MIKGMTKVGVFFIALLSFAGCVHSPVDTVSLSMSEWAQAKKKIKVEFAFSPTFVDKATRLKIISENNNEDIVVADEILKFYLKEPLLPENQQLIANKQGDVVVDFDNISQQLYWDFIELEQLENMSLSNDSLYQPLQAALAIQRLTSKQVIENPESSNVMRVVIKVAISKSADRAGLVATLTQLEEGEPRRNTKRVTVEISYSIKKVDEIRAAISDSGIELIKFITDILSGALPFVPQDEFVTQRNVMVLNPFGKPSSGYRLIDKKGGRAWLRKKSKEQFFDKEQRSFINFKTTNYFILDAGELDNPPPAVVKELEARENRRRQQERNARINQLHYEANQRRINKIRQKAY